MNIMASIYDNIKNPKDLLILVQRQGLSTKDEDISRVQDIFGHASEEELVALANDNGRNDSNGNPDPRGSWSSGRDGLSKEFYFVLFKIWSWEDATRFFNRHSNFQLIDEKEELEGLKTEVVKANETIKKLETELQQAKDLFDTEKERADGAEVDMLRSKSQLEKANDEIIRLKARLYDLLEANCQ